MTENGPGLVNVTVKDESAVIPDQIVAGSTGELTAVLGPVIIELEPIDVAPPITVPGGVRYHVYFDKDSSELDKVVKGGNEAPNPKQCLCRLGTRGSKLKMGRDAGPLLEKGGRARGRACQRDGAWNEPGATFSL